MRERAIGVHGEDEMGSDVVMAGEVLLFPSGPAQCGLAPRWAAVAPAQGSRPGKCRLSRAPDSSAELGWAISQQGLH